MNAVHLTAILELSIVKQPTPEPLVGEARVRLKAAALNHRDVWIKQGQYAGLKFPSQPGSDGAGVVEKVGAGVGAGPGDKTLASPRARRAHDALYRALHL